MTAGAAGEDWCRVRDVAKDNPAGAAPDPGYAGADFDRYYRDAAASRQLGELFHQH
jgi:hypothetical protein